MVILRLDRRTHELFLDPAITSQDDDNHTINPVIKSKGQNNEQHTSQNVFSEQRTQRIFYLCALCGLIFNPSPVNIPVMQHPSAAVPYRSPVQTCCTQALNTPASLPAD